MSIEIKDLENIDKKEINISDLSSNEIEMIELNGLINIPLIKGDKGDKGDTGKDGYTPIKGIDYFDGQNGINGENGKDGADGQNGYTPIKGEDYFTEEEIQEIKSNILDQVNQFSVLVVEELPTEDIDDHTIYFVPKTKAEQDDVYDEYIYINNGWEHIGTTEVDLSSYYKKDEIDTKLSEVEGNEVYIGQSEEAPSSAKIIVEEKDLKESSTLSKSEVYIGADEPSCGEKVWFRKGKNLFNGILSKGGINSVDGTNNDSLSSIRSNYIKVNGNTIYTLSSVDNYNNYIIFYNKNYEYISYYGKENSINTFTTPANCSYIRFVTYSSLNVTDITSKFQLDQNSKVREYEDYIEPQIYVRNSNGVYEEFIKMHEEIYSTDERIIGKWTDGKDLYEKVIYVKTNTTSKNGDWINTESEIIDNKADLCLVKYAYVNSSGNREAIPYYNNAGYGIKAFTREKKVVIAHNTTDFNSLIIPIIVNYTKTD